MSRRKENICRLCFNVPGNKVEEIDEITREMLDVLMLKMNLDVSKNPIICQGCLKMVNQAFDFKSVCVNTEELIFSLSVDKDKDKIDMKDVYIGQDNIEGFDENFSICRFCINHTEINDFVPMDFLTKDKIFMEMLTVYMPEMDITVIKNPVICTCCKEALECYFKFAKNCMYIEEKIKAYCQDKGTNSMGQVRLSNILPFLSKNNDAIIKIEDICIKEEPVDKNVKIKIENPNLYEEYDVNNIKNELPDGRNSTTDADNVSNKKIYRCKTCTYRTKQKNKFNKHILTHKKMYGCIKCTYKTNYTSQLNIHMISTHEHITESEMYECTVCAFKTKYRTSMNRHLLRHKDTSVVEVHKCKICNYETEDKVNLKNHMSSHKNASGDMYKCSMCTFVTKYKPSIQRHMLMHKDVSEIHIYKCTLCNYEGKYKNNLEKHMLTHKDATELKMYQCAVCSFKTCRKFYLRKHFLVHRKGTEMETYKCPMCVYETYRQVYLKKHMMRHQDPTEGKIHTCTMCTYATNRKDCLNVHLKTHNKPAEVEELFQCAMCTYDTNRKCYLEKHMLLHRDSSTK